MRASLAKWIGDADVLRHLRYFRIAQPAFAPPVQDRPSDYFISLVGELFDLMRRGEEAGDSWAQLGNALSQFADRSDNTISSAGVAPNEARLFSAAAFYCGGFPASACLLMRAEDSSDESEASQACRDLLARPLTPKSAVVARMLEALRLGTMEDIDQEVTNAAESTAAMRELGPKEWIPARLFEQLVRRFQSSNLRAVLPDGDSSFWTPLVDSLLDAGRSSWEYFPSQAQAIRQGLLDRQESFSLQMPTGAGKTTLCETLLFSHLMRNPTEIGVLLVPYRSLASELRGTLVRRLNAMGVAARCAYGGTVPVGNEVRDLEGTRALIATPEALAGLLNADAALLGRIGLVVCDEGHLLDGGERGVGLELLLARLRGREGRPPRFVFVSAIVPNIEEINAWLGGRADSVVRSDYRPALAEFAVLAPGSRRNQPVGLVLHPHELPPRQFAVKEFLTSRDFSYVNPTTGRPKTYGFSSVKTQAIATARKALEMGVAAVFAANKRGNQGAIGLAEELIAQLNLPLALPSPDRWMKRAAVDPAADYLEGEYGAEWIGTLALRRGAVIHHGDIPQESREVVEGLVRSGGVRLAICTSTLAEGVNLPVRTLVLYSVQRRLRQGEAQDLLARDIKNLVGRAGRAGATTRGLVVCANPRQWWQVAQVAHGMVGERVNGALIDLVRRLRRALAVNEAALTNELLEETVGLQTLVDGVDATLIDLISEEIGEERFRQIARGLADQTFAARQSDDVSKTLLQEVFELRARRVLGLRSSGRLEWIRQTGARVRMLQSVESGLLPLASNWNELPDEPTAPEVVRPILEWARSQPDVATAVSETLRVEATEATAAWASVSSAVRAWLDGKPYHEIAREAGLPIDDLLGVQSRIVGHVLQTTVEQGVALLKKLLEGRGVFLSQAVAEFPEFLRFGVPTRSALALASRGVRHRRAAVELGSDTSVAARAADSGEIWTASLEALRGDVEGWKVRLGELVFQNTLSDLESFVG